MKDLVITHNDLDGISPIILMNLTNRPFDYKYMELREVEAYLDELLKEDVKTYDNIFICDLSLSEATYEKLIESKANFKVYDHHETHLFANKYPFATVEVTKNNRLTCATEIFYNELCKLTPELSKENIRQYVELVRQIDTFTFTDNSVLNLAMLLDFFGKNEFIKLMTSRLKKNKPFALTSFEKRYCRLKQEENLRYMQKKESQMLKYMIADKKCGIVFAERNKSELGNYLSTKYPELDLIILIDASSRISYRTNREDVRANDFASLFGGGGHKKASGSKFDDADREEILEAYYKDIHKLDA